MRSPPDAKESPQTGETVGGPKNKRDSVASKGWQVLAVKPDRYPSFKGWPWWLGQKWAFQGSPRT